MQCKSLKTVASSLTLITPGLVVGVALPLYVCKPYGEPLELLLVDQGILKLTR
ncbi:MAG: hypothetical protein WCJ99_08075 [Betaproteobacteria bacterium]